MEPNANLRRPVDATQEVNVHDILEMADVHAPPSFAAPAPPSFAAPAPPSFAAPAPRALLNPPPPRSLRAAQRPTLPPVRPPSATGSSVAPVAMDLTQELARLDGADVVHVGLEDDEPLPVLPRRRLGWVVTSAVGVSALILATGLVRRVTSSDDDSTVVRTASAATIATPKITIPPAALKTTASIPSPVATTKAQTPPATNAATASAVPVIDFNSLPQAPPTGTVIGPAGRLYVDGKRMSGSAAIVPCGKHTVRIAPAWRTRSVDVPCGGEIKVR